jgi:hypothetical protein
MNWQGRNVFGKRIAVAAINSTQDPVVNLGWNLGSLHGQRHTDLKLLTQSAGIVLGTPKPNAQAQCPSPNSLVQPENL